jgi:hypothetical protein
MRSFFVLITLLFLCLQSSSIWGQVATSPNDKQGGSNTASTPPRMTRVPSDVILVKGAWHSSSDSTTPLPEDSRVRDGAFQSQYFGVSLPLRPGWTQKYDVAPPSDSGQYTLAQLASPEHDGVNGTFSIGAQDLFFARLPVTNSIDVVNYATSHLPSYYKLEVAPTETRIRDRPFHVYGYRGATTGLHWYIAATDIRCHAVEFVMTSRDSKSIEILNHDLTKIDFLSASSTVSGDGTPVCIKDYVRDENLLTRVDPVFVEHRFNPVPVRIVIGKDGLIKHIHFISAFPEQATAVSEALKKWKFKPYLQDGKPTEVETGIMFGRAESAGLTSTKPAERE